MVGGQTAPPTGEAAAKPEPKQPPAEEKVNLPLKDSNNERARALVDLDRKFLVDPLSMSASAAVTISRVMDWQAISSNEPPNAFCRSMAPNLARKNAISPPCVMCAE